MGIMAWTRVEALSIAWVFTEYVSQVHVCLIQAWLCLENQTRAIREWRKNRHIYRKAGLRSSICSLMESHPHATTSDFFIITVYNMGWGEGVGLAGGLCRGVVSGCEHPGGGSHRQCFLYTLSAFTLGSEKGSANRLSLTWGRLYQFPRLWGTGVLVKNNMHPFRTSYTPYAFTQGFPFYMHPVKGTVWCFLRDVL